MSRCSVFALPVASGVYSTDRRAPSELYLSFQPYPSLLDELTMVLIVTSDNGQFVVNKDVAECSLVIKDLLECKSFFRFIYFNRRPRCNHDDHSPRRA
jgi:hypothetical protein